MAENQKDRYIQYLIERNQKLELKYRALELACEEVVAQYNRMEGLQAKRDAEFEQLKAMLSETLGQLADANKANKAYERKVKSLQEQLDCTNEKLYGDKWQRVKKATADIKYFYDKETEIQGGRPDGRGDTERKTERCLPEYADKTPKSAE